MAYNILILDPNIYKVYFAGQSDGQRTVMNVRDWCIRENADLCFNLGVFDMKTGVSCCYVKGPNMLSDAGGDKHPTIGGKSNVLVLDSQNECKGYSNGIIDNTVKINAPMGGSSYRCGIGITNLGHRIIAQSSNTCTEAVFCNAVNTFVRKQGQTVKLFVLQDGGGSTSEYSALSKLSFYPKEVRKVPTVVCVSFKVKPAFTSPVYNGSKGEDTKRMQIALGGIECDGVGGNGTETRIKAMQVAYNFPKKLQNGAADAYTFSKMGFSINY